MSLFQKSVIKKYLNELNENQIIQSYQEFQTIFNNPAKQANILNSKEEQYQEGFLRELFVKIFGYVLNPDENYNLITEQKNEKGSKKADGAILNGLSVLAVIELKSTKTIDLASIESQAFGYKNNQSGCKYVITSNFKKLRFYIDHAVDFEEFDLFTLTIDQFKILWLCIHANHLLKNIPSQIKEASNHQEEQITKYLYKDYAEFRNSLFNNICEKNQNFDRLFLFKKTQKLLDRFLFLFFAEDRGLVSPNWTRKILQDWSDLKDKYDNYIPLYNRFRKNFDYLNTGYHGKDGEIFAYNGGLFIPDEVLDSLTIDDDLLYKGSLKLSNYDFESEVDVNILGHIFEHSLNEIDEIQASLEENQVEKVTKRKKDGVFYTPKYITKYIVENTIGTLCKEQKEKLEIVEEDFEFIDAKAPKKLTDKRKALNQKIDDYRNWLLALKIVDPACGSGAFLNQALEFLIAQHSKLDELRARLLGGSLVLSDVENSILENNLYGVDINEEAVEIAKLSLWLRTARKGRKLNSLNQNLKCGNSLIDDVEVAGDKAFNWNTEFKEVFDKGGFDVVIGNPPYVRSRELFSEEEKKYYLKIYKATSYQLDLYKLFIEKSCFLINNFGRLSFITPSVFLTNDYDKPLRQFILDNYSIEIIATSDSNVFDDASVKTAIFLITHFKLKSVVTLYKIDNTYFHSKKTIQQSSFVEQGYLINEKINNIAIPIINKMNEFSRMGEFFEIKNGIKIRKELLYNKNGGKTFKPFILGKNIQFYQNSFDNIFIDYKAENEKLYTNQAFRTPDIFEQDKLITRQILGKRIITCYDNQKLYTDQTTYVINKKVDNHNLKYLLCLLNSKLLFFYFQNTFSDNKITFPKVKRSQLLELPYPNIEDQNEFVDLANKLIDTIRESKYIIENFAQLLKSKFKIEKLTTKLKNWHELKFIDLLNELSKAKVNLNLSEQAEWLEYFEEQKVKALAIKTQIEETDKEIDKMVYELYELTEEEIKIVEGV